jgi:hypothetical protein
VGEEAADIGDLMDDPQLARAAFRAILRHLPLPLSLQIGVEDAFRALEAGEVMPLLAPRKIGLHGKPHTLAKLRMRAVEHANFQHGKGVGLMLAESRISRLFGVEQPTLKSWEVRDLPRVLGAQHVRDAIERARAAGKLIEEVRHDRAHMDSILGYAGTLEWELITLARLLEAENVADVGAEYKQALH